MSIKSELKEEREEWLKSGKSIEEFYISRKEKQDNVVYTSLKRARYFGVELCEGDIIVNNGNQYLIRDFTEKAVPVVSLISNGTNYFDGEWEFEGNFQKIELNKGNPLAQKEDLIEYISALHLQNNTSRDLDEAFKYGIECAVSELENLGKLKNMNKETLEKSHWDDKKVEDYYIGKTLKLKKRIPSRYYEATLQESETIKIDKFVDGDVEGCRIAVGYKDGFEFLLFNTTHIESYLQGAYSLIDEPTITQEESLKMKKLELSPCPFCAGKAKIEQTGRNKLKLKCTNCLIGIEQKSLRFSLDWLENRMIENWNKRV